MAGLNLELINQRYISRVVPRSTILIYTFNQQSNINYELTVTYNTPIMTTAQVQLEKPQNLMHIQGLNLSEIYKRFYIQSDSITGLNRNLSTGGDYIIMNNLKYTIISVVEKFNTGWTQVVGVESSLDE